MARPRTPSLIATGALGAVALLGLTLTLAAPARAGVGDGQLDPVVAEKAALAAVGVSGGEVSIDGSFRVATNGCDDQDGDGVCDESDLCLDTAQGAPVDDAGCSIAQLCPCNGPKDGGQWNNHGDYVSCVSHTANTFKRDGLITGKEKGKIVSDAAKSDCGKKTALLCGGGSSKCVFVSSTTHTGNLGGLNGADAICQGLAEADGSLAAPGIYKAWLSDDTAWPEVRFTQSTVPYWLVDGEQVATDWGGLVSANADLEHAIDVTERGGKLGGEEVWTGTCEDGSISCFVLLVFCQGWLSDVGVVPGTLAGLADQVDGDWTRGLEQRCDRDLRLYCFQQ